MLKSFCMDDLLPSVYSFNVECTLATERIGGFRFTKFVSNSPVVIASLPAVAVSQRIFLDIGGEQLEKALGIT